MKSEAQGYFANLDIDSMPDARQIDKTETSVSQSKQSEIDWQTEAGKWATRFWWAMFFWLFTIAIFAYVTNSLSTQIDMLAK